MPNFFSALFRSFPPLFLCAVLFLVGCNINESNSTIVDDEVVLIPKQIADSKGKTQNSNQTSPYSCLISTLLGEDAEFNYWNRAFYVHFSQEIIDEANGENSFYAIGFGSQKAEKNAGSWIGKNNIVRVAQCVLPANNEAIKLLKSQLRMFGTGVWKENRKEAKNKGDYECVSWEWEFSCNFEDGMWIEGEEPTCSWEEICTWYKFVEDEPGPFGGGGSGGGGFGSEEPGECDPLGTEPCINNPNGGGWAPDGNTCPEGQIEDENGVCIDIEEPCEIELEALEIIFPNSSTNTLSAISETVKNNGVKFDINEKESVTHFLAQTGYESQGMTSFTENMNYSAERLMAVWPNRFSYTDPTKKNPNEYAYNPEKLANYVYANRLGNGSELSGNGWNYRG